MKRRSSARSASPKGVTAADRTSATAVIESLGARGHGMARIDDRKVFVPYALPGECVSIEYSGAGISAVSIERPSADRIAPVCPHFGTCGGCSLQHWRAEPYQAWKESLITPALARKEIEVKVESFKTYPLSSRRRATLAAMNTGGEIKLGFSSQRSHALVDLTECPVLLPEIATALPSLRACLAAALPLRGEARLHLTSAANGLDCTAAGPPLSSVARTQFVAALPGAGFVRFAWNGEIIFLVAAPFVLSGGVRVALPPNAFLQAVEACERDMGSWVTEAIVAAGMAKNGAVCDLFAGLGAFTFPAAKLAPVTAYEESASAVLALSAAGKQAKGFKPITALRRDLYRNPLGSLELNTFCAVIMDPPREGAEAQCHALVASRVAVAVMVSCNPASFARDAAILAGGGFQLERLTAFDQFRFSAHVEMAGLFLRPATKKGGPKPALIRR